MASSPKKTREIFDDLEQLAAAQGTATYGQVGRVVGVHHRNVSRPLGWIRDHICRASGLPELNVLVVNASTRLPGSGVKADGGGGFSRLVWEEEKQRVFAHSWDQVEFPAT